MEPKTSVVSRNCDVSRHNVSVMIGLVLLCFGVVKSHEVLYGSGLVRFQRCDMENADVK